MLDINKLVEGIELERDLIFTSISSKDKKTALRLVKRLNNMRFKHWCMYDENGNERNIGGDVYTHTISSAIAHCCVFIYLMSEHSIESGQVKNELEQISSAVKDGTAKVVPIFVDDTPNTDIPEYITELTGIDKHMITRRYYVDSTDDEIDAICEEIKEQYFNVLFENIKRKFALQKNSQMFNALLNSCVRQKSVSQPISDDIKGSAEISEDSLKEMHVLSNELYEYDCNTYSCMVIASNLLGAEDTVRGVRKYSPAKKGVKYFYYIPSGYESEFENVYDKIKEFICKTPDSRREVTALIRKEFSLRNKIVPFFQGFNNMTIEDFKEHYHISEPIDVKNFDALFSSESAQSYFAYSDTDDVFSVPEEFLAWVSGNNDKYSYNTMLEISYDFIDFIGNFVEFLVNSKDANMVSTDRLKRRFSYLDRFRTLENWQVKGEPIMTVSQSKRLVNYLLDFSADSSDKSIKKFPRLANWMQFYLTESGEICDLDEDILQEALNNLVCVPINEDDRLQLCYSFALFLGKTENSGSWYTTGLGINNGQNEHTVTGYNFGKRSQDYKDMIEAFMYMISINPQAKDLLKSHRSELLNIIKEYGKRGTRK